MSDDRVYRIQLQYVPEQEHFIGRAGELGLEVEAATRAEALQKIESEVEAEVERLAVEGKNLPRPIDLQTEPGKLELELAAPVYRDLLTHARAQELEPEALALQLLTRALGHLDGRSSRRTRGGPAAASDDAKPNSRGHSDAPAKSDDGSEGRGGGERRKGRGRGRGGRREGYRPDMENQANFLAYVRDQERGGGGGGGGSGGGGRGRR